MGWKILIVIVVIIIASLPFWASCWMSGETDEYEEKRRSKSVGDKYGDD